MWQAPFPYLPLPNKESSTRIAKPCDGREWRGGRGSFLLVLIVIFAQAGSNSAVAHASNWVPPQVSQAKTLLSQWNSAAQSLPAYRASVVFQLRFQPDWAFNILVRHCARLSSYAYSARFLVTVTDGSRPLRSNLILRIISDNPGFLADGPIRTVLVGGPIFQNCRASLLESLFSTACASLMSTATSY